ncbi:MAG: glutathione S-transferase [Tistrella sp.]|uniref:glutathione S-transferase family protein n=1 Tax=Tistrella sp. TaxID=2024861 RepID=UPI000C5A0010|nr:glutathione S-transferase family protein [Tistrella sp.]MAD39929.1 glutathione S-transferase [Tistrella sp.]MBA77687.1 glutathione S-transferase [Tistrella sp.]
MSDELILYTNPQSRGMIARWMLEEVGVPYRIVVLEYGAPMKAPDYLALNPMGKVPTLVHNGAVVTEAAAICAYLAETFPEAGLAPRPHERAAWFRWLFFGAGPLEAAIINRALGIEVPAERERSIGYGNFTRVMDTLEVAVSASPYLAGDRFTAADVYLGAQIGWGLQFGTMERRPAFETYWARLAGRPALARASATDDVAG